MRGRRCCPVEEDGKSQGAQDLGGPAGQPDGVVYGGAFERDEGEHVEHAHPGMLPGLGGQVELGRARLGEGDGAREHGVLLAGERQDAAVVVGVGVEAENTDAGDGADGVGDARDLRPVSSPR